MADFNFYLNRQGVKGNKGEKGDTGFAPIVEVAEDTAASYKLRIITDSDTLETPNLRGSAVDDLGGTYMRYDPETQKMYASTANSATTSSQGEVILASEEAVANLSDVHALTPASLVDNYGALIQSSDGSVAITQDVVNSKIDLRVDNSSIEGDIINLQNNKVDKVAGKGLSTNDFTDADKSKLDSSLQPTSVDGTTIGLNAGGQLTLLAQIPTVPTNISAFTNDSGYITGIDSSDVTTALGYTPYDSSNPNGYTSNVGTVTSVNNVSPVSGNVTISIPTDTSDLTNGAGYITSSALNGYATENFVTSQGYITSSALTPYVLASSLATVATTGDYDDLTNKPTIPTVNNGTLTIQQNGTTIGTFTANDTNNVTANISVPTDTNDLTNGAGFITSVPTATTSSLGLVQPDGTTITVNNGVISASSSAPSNMVTTNTAQTIEGNKTFQNSNLVLGSSTYSRFYLSNTYGDTLRPESSSSTGLMHFVYNSNYNVATISSNRTNIDGATRGLLRILPTTIYNHPETEGYIMTHNLVDMSYKPYLTSSKITSTGNTVTITDNGMNGINIEAASSAPTNMVTTDTSQTISANKSFTGNVDKDFSGDTLRLGTSGAGKSGIVCLSNNGARTWSICNSGYTASTLEITDFNSVTIQGGNTSSDSKLVVSHDSLVFHKSDNTSVDLLAGGSTPSNMVTTDTSQTISGHKVFSDYSTEIKNSLYVTKYGTSQIFMGEDTTYAVPILSLDDTNDILTIGETGKYLKLKSYNTTVISNQRGNEFTIGYDTLTYKKSDSTVVDLLALESRIAALEARINGGNA